MQKNYPFNFYQRAQLALFFVPLFIVAVIAIKCNHNDTSKAREIAPSHMEPAAPAQDMTANRERQAAARAAGSIFAHPPTRLGLFFARRTKMESATTTTPPNTTTTPPNDKSRAAASRWE